MFHFFTENNNYDFDFIYRYQRSHPGKKVFKIIKIVGISKMEIVLKEEDLIFVMWKKEEIFKNALEIYYYIPYWQQINYSYQNFIIGNRYYT